MHIVIDILLLTEIVDLQEIIVQNLSDPRLFHADSLHFIRDHISNRGRIIGVISGKSLIAYRIVAFPGNDHDNLGIDLGLAKRNKVAHLESFSVHPEYRGNLLQLKTLGPTIRIIRDFGYEHLCATVSPNNYPGLRNLLKGGLVIRGLKEKYGGKLRYILYQNLKKPMGRDTDHTITLSWTDIEGQERVLGEGYYGYEVRRSAQGHEVLYGRSRPMPGSLDDTGYS